MTNSTAKRCPACGQDKPRDAFSASLTRSDGLQGECKPCRSARDAKYRASHAEQERERHARYHAENRDRLLPKYREWRRRAYYADPERERVARWAYWHRMTDVQRQAYYLRYRDSRHRAAGLRRARIMGTMAEPITRAAIIARDNSTCYLCDRAGLTDRQIHLDHVIPLARGGTHTADNIRVACRPCNYWKSDRLLSEL